MPTIKTTDGTGSSPILYKDLVFLAQDQNEADSVFLALDKRPTQLYEFQFITLFDGPHRVVLGHRVILLSQ